jgi:hypothetical protein
MEACTTKSSLNQEFPGAAVWHLLFSIFTNNMPMTVYVCVDSTMYMSATTSTEMTATLNIEMQLVSEWVSRNKLVLNISDYLKTYWC